MISAFSTLAGPQYEAAVAAGVLLYRIYFWFVPIPHRLDPAEGDPPREVDAAGHVGAPRLRQGRRRRLTTRAIVRPGPAPAARAIIAGMTQQFARVPDGRRRRSSARCAASAACPWGRLFRYLRPQLAPVLDRARRPAGRLLGHRPRVPAGHRRDHDRGRGRWRPGRPRPAVVMLVVLFCIQAVGSFVQTYLLGVVGERVVAQLRGELFGRLVTLSLDFHGQRRVGELVSRLSSDVTLVRTMLTQTVTSLLSSVIGLVGSVIILFTLSPTLLFIVLLLAPALIAVAIVFGRPLQRVSTQVQDTIARSTTTAEEALSGIRVVKSYVREDWELERYDADLRTVVATGSRLALWRAVFGALMGFLGLRGDRRAALVHRPPGHRRHARDRDADRVPAVRRRHRREPRDHRRAVRPVPGGDRGHRARLRDHRHAADDRRRAGRRPMPGSPAGSSSTACRSATSRSGRSCTTCR